MTFPTGAAAAPAMTASGPPPPPAMTSPVSAPLVPAMAVPAPPPSSGASASGAGGGTVNVTSEGLGVGSAPQGSLLQRLGLHPGDVVKSINGQPIGASTDVTRLYQSIVNGESVSAEVVRGG